MRPIALGVVALTGAVLLTGCAGNTDGQAVGGRAGGSTEAPVSAPAEPTGPSSPTAPTTTAPTTPTATTNARTSDLSQLRRLGISLDADVLIDVADDGVDRWLEVARDGSVDFTGGEHTNTTMMSLTAAPVTERNRVLLKPPFWSEEVDDGYCVTDTPGATLRLEECTTGSGAQIWEVVPAGDSGQFELRGAYGILRVEDGRLTTGPSGRTGLQTITYAD
ncbi:hypothetical protein ACFOOK_01120 [Micromonospora krabiensis]|uniref:Ricin B lectin domain-containing protein n=1 Tax=Micromonospora krabiensis TaxID=307121 RepID=A0A1C3MXF9_9ACTN|nr:hypothetical protein [Micromonospora krabiensis]SBV25017.1 hypothetical protein GA0070620_0485 [Micromonospora krabiensis]